ncbi:hypothetical protein Plhal304r1_c070g0159211 [Plasmopara halstedii]
MTKSELAALALDEFSPNCEDNKPHTIDIYLHKVVNALFLIRQFTMRFVERMDSCPLLAHFSHDLKTYVQNSTTST